MLLQDQNTKQAI